MRIILIALMLTAIGIMILTICTILWHITKRKVLIPLGMRFLDLYFEDAYKELKVFYESIEDMRHQYEVADAENKASTLEQTINDLRAEVNCSFPDNFKRIFAWKRNIDEIIKMILDNNQNIEIFFQQRKEAV